MSNTETQSQRNGLGIYPRIGLEFGHARLMLEYNFIQNMNDYVSPEFNPMKYFSLLLLLFAYCRAKDKKLVGSS